MKKYHDIVLDNTGNAVLSATITVSDNGGGVSTIYSDNVLTAQDNPFTASSIDGAYSFYAANGRYDINILATGFTTENLTDVVLFDNGDIYTDFESTGIDDNATSTQLTLTDTEATFGGNVFANNLVEKYDDNAALEAITAAPQITLAKTKGLATDNDGGQGDWIWDATSTATANVGTILKATTITTGRWLRLYSGDVEFKWFGAKGDGSTSDSTAFDNATDYTDTTGEWLNISPSSGDYILATAITKASLSNPLRIRGNDVSSLKYTGSETDYAILVSDTNGNNIVLEDLMIDANLLASVCFRATNSSASMADANIGRLDVKGGSYINGYMNTGQTVGSAGIRASGGFSEVKCDDVLLDNMSRDTGAGIIGTSGSSGIVVAYSSINAYCKKFIYNGGEIKTITNNETTGVADDVDCDGIIYTAPTATENGGLHVPAVFISRETTFENCKGRGVKTQLDGFSMVTDFIVKRNLEEAIANAHEFDFQRGGGVVGKGVMYYDEKSGGGTTLGTSHVPVQISFDQLAVTSDNQDGGIFVDDIAIYNSIPRSVDTLTHLVTIINDDTSRKLTGMHVRNFSMMGGRMSRVVKYTGGSAEESTLEISGCTGDIITSLVQLVNAASDKLKLILNGNTQSLSTNTTELVELASDVVPTVSGHSNNGFVANYRSKSSANTVGEIFRTGSIGGDTADGHIMSAPQSITLADDATHTFESTGTYGIGMITSNFNDTVQPMFTHDNGGFVEITPASAAVTFGTTTNPDVDGDLNIWIDGTTLEINIKNRLGSSRIFHLFHSGGD